MLGLSLNDEPPMPSVEEQQGMPQQHEEPPPPPADPVYAQLYLKTGSNYLPYWVYSAEIENSVTLVVVNKNQVSSLK
jgi:hypothetical protein